MVCVNGEHKQRAVYSPRTARRFIGIIEIEYLGPIAETMGYGEDDEAGMRLYTECRKRSDNVGNIIEALAKEIKP